MLPLNALVLVTEHITQGERCDSHFCALALALRDAGYVESHVSNFLRGWTIGDRVDVYRVTDELDALIEAFDNQQPVVPARYAMEYLLSYQHSDANDAACEAALTGLPGTADLTALADDCVRWFADAGGQAFRVEPAGVVEN